MKNENINLDFIELINIDDIIFTSEYVNMVDISVEEDESFILSNGIITHNSANNALREFRDPQYQGAYVLKGKVSNVSELKASEIMNRDELIGMMGAIGLKLGEPPVNLRYSKIYICCDADTDGDAITALIINFFNKYWGDLFRQKRIYRVLTPICVVKQGKSKQYFYTSNEFNDWAKKKDLKKYDIEYKKGLASLEDEEYKLMLQDPKTFIIKKDDNADKALKVWFEKDSEPRKKELLK